MIDVVGGQIPLVFTAIASAQQYVRTGRLVALGVPGAKRSAALPDVPTFQESGLAGFDVDSWVGIFAPAKTPPRGGGAGCRRSSPRCCRRRS